MNNAPVENKYEQRRLALASLVADIGRGAIATIAKSIEVEPNYLSRCLYPKGKAGKKNIGEETLEKLAEKYPNWFCEKPRPSLTLNEDVADYVVARKPKIIQIPNTLIDDLNQIATKLSDEGLRLVISYAKGVETGYPKENKANKKTSSACNNGAGK